MAWTFIVAIATSNLQYIDNERLGSYLNVFPDDALLMRRKEHSKV